MSPEDFYIEVGRRIAAARAEAKMTQDELGRLLGVSGAAVNRWENAVNRIQLAELRRLADILGKPVAWFLGAEVNDRDVFFYRFRTLPPEQQQQARDFVEFLQGKAHKTKDTY